MRHSYFQNDCTDIRVIRQTNAVCQKGFWWLFVLAVWFISCTKTVEIGNKVSITGTVKLIDDQGLEVEPKSGVLVSIQDYDINEYTQEDGTFMLTNMSPGVSYKVDFSKYGYGSLTNKETGKFIGNQKPGNMGTIFLYLYPEAELQNPALTISNNLLHLTGDLADAKFGCFFSVYVNDSANVSENHYDYRTGGAIYEAAPFNVALNIDKYLTGTTVFVSVYFTNRWDQGYWDYETRRNVYSSSKRVAFLSQKITQQEP